MACVALGTRPGPVVIPLPRPQLLSTTADVPRLAAEAAGLPLTGDAAGALCQAVSYSRIGPDGPVPLRADHLFGPLLQGHLGPALGEAPGTLLWPWLRFRSAGEPGVADRVAIADDCAAVLRLAAQGARAAGRTAMDPEHLLIALAQHGQTLGACLLGDAGLDAARLRALFSTPAQPASGSAG